MPGAYTVQLVVRCGPLRWRCNLEFLFAHYLFLFCVKKTVSRVSSRHSDCFQSDAGHSTMQVGHSVVDVWVKSRAQKKHGRARRDQEGTEAEVVVVSCRTPQMQVDVREKPAIP
jgi:hypothetical protein